MSADFELQATSRADVGKGASRRLRRLEKKIPAIVYGGNKTPANITLGHDDLFHHLENEAFFSHIITLKIDGAAEDVLLKDLQRHPAKPLIMHADFLRVNRNQPIVVNVPLHFINEETSPGVKLQGGRISHSVNELEIRCLPKDLPEYIEVDMGKAEIGDVMHISDIVLPAGVESMDLSHGEEHDLAIANIAVPKGGSDEDEAEAEAAAAESEANSADEESKDAKDGKES